MARSHEATARKLTPVLGGADKYESRLTGTKRGSLTWADAGVEDLVAAIVAVTEDGAAMLLSKTSDGGALCVQVWHGAGRHKLYPSSAAELNEALALLTEIAQS